MSLARFWSMNRTYGGVFASVVLIGSTLVTCMPRADDTFARPIPGTEEVAIEEFCITVSPDERWLTFVEWRVPYSMRVKEQASSEYDRRIVSLNLETGARTQHSIDSLSPGALGYSNDPTQWKARAGFKIIKERFRPPGWIGETFYFQRYGRRTYLAIDPSQSDIRIVADPGTTGTCSDCPPLLTAEVNGRSWDLLSDDVSAVVLDGAVRSVYYRGSRPNRTHTILRLRPGGQEELIVDRHRSEGTMVTIATLRVSPDEKYLAYVVHSKKQEFLSGPREDLFIRELETAREMKVASYSLMGNLIWSPGSGRLYFAGGGLTSDAAVRVIDVVGTFSH